MTAITAMSTMVSYILLALLLFQVGCNGQNDYSQELFHKKWFRPGELFRIVMRRDSRVCGQQIIPPLLKIDPKTQEPLIVGGSQAEPGSWPWMVTLKNDLVGAHWCAGVLIAYKWVLTAAHCFNRPFNEVNKWTIRLGKHNAFVSNETGEEVHAISRQFIHPLYDNTTKEHDIALLEMDETLELYSDRILPLCVADKKHRKLRTGEHCVITGWGETKGTSNPLYLNQAVVPIVDHRICRELYPGRVTDTMICAGYIEGGTDSCQGDSGGPLMCLKKGKHPKWYVAGIISWGDDCAKEWKPGVYTKVSSYWKWIEDTIKLHAFV